MFLSILNWQYIKSLIKIRYLDDTCNFFSIVKIYVALLMLLMLEFNVVT